MFNDIAPRYDYLNHRLSFGIDRIWRRKTSKLVAKFNPSTILDVATGTADLAIRLAKDNPEAIISGVDISTKMLSLGQQKIQNRKLGEQIHLEHADVVSLPFSDDSFDTVTVAFGVRNFGNLEGGLREMIRVCRENGLVAVLEFSHPTNVLVKTPYQWYSRRCIPKIGQRISGHPSAYSYLLSSVEAFPTVEAFKAMLEKVGVNDIHTCNFSGGIATLYYGFVLKNP